VFENRVLRRVFGPKRDEVTGNGENYIMRSLVICTSYPILCRLRVFENRVLRRVFGPKRDEVTGNGENYIMRSLMICTPYPILCRC
jgi:hypothetical protein